MLLLWLLMLKNPLVRRGGGALTFYCVPFVYCAEFMPWVKVLCKGGWGA